MHRSIRFIFLIFVATFVLASYFYLSASKIPGEKLESDSSQVATIPPATTDDELARLPDIQNENDFPILETEQSEGSEKPQVSPIRDLTSSEERRVEPALRAKFYKNGDPQGYRRHRLVHIDTEALRSRLESTSLTNSDTGQPDLLSISLFEDQSIDVGINIWVDGGPGITSGYGQSSLAPGLPDSASFTFDSNGRFEGSIRGRDFGYLLANVLDNTYYVVFELDYPTSTD